jgi:anion-transporting  ArsA/GET3 family ATPase
MRGHRRAARAGPDLRHRRVIAAATRGRSRAFWDFVAAAPGAKELVTSAKAVDLAGSDACDLGIVDGPSTGHALGMLAAPGTVGRVARAGPVGEQARQLQAFLADPSREGYVGVSLLEEMSLHELLELDAGLREAVGRGLNCVVVDGVYPDRFTDAEAARLEALAADAGQIRAALIQHRRARVHAERAGELRRRVPAPVLTLPFVFETELGPADYELLARGLPRETSTTNAGRPQHSYRSASM